MEKPTLKELCDAADISKGYASDILAGKQSPSRPLAIHIYRKTGWRHSLIADLADKQLEVLEAVEPWIPTANRPKQKAAG